MNAPPDTPHQERRDPGHSSGSGMRGRAFAESRRFTQCPSREAHAGDIGAARCALLSRSVRDGSRDVIVRTGKRLAGTQHAIA